jgi:hypothetical protein
MRASFIIYFLEIAEEEERQYEHLLKSFKAVHDETLPFTTDEEMEIISGLEKSCIKIIVFLTNYLEAYIWDVAASHLGESDAGKLDKLAIPDKWEIIPRLVTQKKDLIKPHERGMLKELVRERNKLMHHKSIDIHPYLGKMIPASQFPKDLINIWQRVHVTSYFQMSKRIVKTLEKELDQMRGF